MRTKHTPLRTCVACRTTGDKRGLLRVVRKADLSVELDLTGKSSGRGAYVCASPVCIALARKKNKLGVSLKTPIPESVFDSLMSQAHPDPG